MNLSIYKVNMKILKKEKKVGISFRLPKTKKRLLKQKCKRQGHKQQDVLEYLVDLFLNDEKRS